MSKIENRALNLTLISLHEGKASYDFKMDQLALK